MARIFISYRRKDNPDAARMVCADVEGHFGDRHWLGRGPRQAEVFFDRDSIGGGTDFREKIEKEIAASDVLLVIIGKKWLHKDRSGKSRLEDPDDMVRAEIVAALESPKTKVIPVLVGGASVPSPDQLPDDLKPLSDLNAIEIDSGPHYHASVHRLRRDVRSKMWLPIMGKEAAGWVAAASVIGIVGYFVLGLLPSGNQDDQIQPVVELSFDTLYVIDDGERKPWSGLFTWDFYANDKLLDKVGDMVSIGDNKEYPIKSRAVPFQADTTIEIIGKVGEHDPYTSDGIRLIEFERSVSYDGSGGCEMISIHPPKKEGIEPDVEAIFELCPTITQPIDSESGS